jgi:membrane protein DedA with SNARE-associated domain
MNDLLPHLGYPAVFLGTLVEGETFILVAGFLAHRGYFDLVPIILLATLGAFTGDLVYFLAGRHYGRALLERSSRAKALVPWLERFMSRHHVLWIFTMRYLYGIRWLGAALAGSSRMSLKRFSALSFPSCLVWATVVGLLGYGAGEMLEAFLVDVARYEIWIALALVLGVLGYALLAWRGERRLESAGFSLGLVTRPGMPGERSRENPREEDGKETAADGDSPVVDVKRPQTEKRG